MSIAHRLAYDKAEDGAAQPENLVEVNRVWNFLRVESPRPPDQPKAKKVDKSKKSMEVWDRKKIRFDAMSEVFQVLSRHNKQTNNSSEF